MVFPHDLQVVQNDRQPPGRMGLFSFSLSLSQRPPTKANQQDARRRGSTPSSQWRSDVSSTTGAASDRPEQQPEEKIYHATSLLLYVPASPSVRATLRRSLDHETGTELSKARRRRRKLKQGKRLGRKLRRHLGDDGEEEDDAEGGTTTDGEFLRLGSRACAEGLTRR